MKRSSAVVKTSYAVLKILGLLNRAIWYADPPIPLWPVVAVHPVEDQDGHVVRAVVVLPGLHVEEVDVAKILRCRMRGWV